MRTTSRGERLPGARRRDAARLEIRGPALLGGLAAIAFLGAGIGGASVMPIDKGVGLPGTVIVETRTQSVQHHRGGIVGAVHVGEGDIVRAGQVVLTLDTQAIGDQIRALRIQADAAGRQLALMRAEAETMLQLHERKLTPRTRVVALERQVAEIEKEAAGLAARILLAEQELERSAMRAPVGGRVLSVSVRGPGGVIQPGQTVLEIVPADDRLVVEGRLAPSQIESVKPGMEAKVWLTGLSWRDRRPLAGRLAWLAPDSVEDRRTGTSYFAARIVLDQPRAELARDMTLHPGMRTEVLLLTGQMTLLEQLLDPLLKNITRAFRS